MRHAPSLIALLFFSLTTTTQADSRPSAAALVEDTTMRMVASIQQNRSQIDADKTALYGLINEILMPHIDFQRMSRWVLGKHWRKTNAEQREIFTEEFRTLIMRTYSTAMLEYSGQKIRVLPVRNQEAATDVTVRTEIRPANGPMIPISYDLYLNDDNTWKVYDVSIDGISLVANYRSSFSSQIRRSGSVAALIHKLQARNQQARK